MSNIGERIIQLRKIKKWSQEDFAKQINASRILIGNCECGVNTPSMEVIIKIARAFDVSIDYLLGEGLSASFDQDTLRGLEDMEKLPDKERKRIFHYKDLIICDYKGKQAYGG